MGISELNGTSVWALPSREKRLVRTGLTTSDYLSSLNAPSTPTNYEQSGYRKSRERHATMKAAVLHNYDTALASPEYVKMEEVPEPRLVNDTDVLVRIGGAGVCRTDLHVIEGIWRQKVDVKLPYIMGHENAGWVEEVGKGAQGFKKGDPVI